MRASTSEKLADLSACQEGELIARSRSGDADAFGELYRRHIDVARRRARRLTRSVTDADEAVAEAFVRILAALRRGRGPEDNFRAYLLTCVHNACVIRGQQARTDLVDPADRLFSTDAPLAEDFTPNVETGMVLEEAFRSMPSRWQAVLWLTEVEDLPAREVSARCDLSPGAVAALSYRARKAFTEAYLGAHLMVPTSAQCSETVSLLPAYVRNNIARRHRRLVEAHLQRCRGCSSSEADLRQLNSSLRS